MSLNIAILEPYYGGSHAQFVDTLVAHSRHRYVLATMPARKWKWRMRGSGIHFARQAVGWIESAPAGGYDLILCSDMLPVADLRALLPRPLCDVPIVCYFHENQLTYPISRDDPRDFHFAVTNIVSCLAADAVWFNSTYHREAFLCAARAMLARMPDHVPASAIKEIATKSVVLAPPVLVEPVRRAAPADKPVREPLILLWCHRWEYDKNPRPFLEALLEMQREQLPFRAMFLGEQFETVPPEFAPALLRLAPLINHIGWLPDRADYLRALAGCDVVISSAIQENFGYAVIEAVLAGCQPLLPDRLAYPEVIGAEFRAPCLYTDDGHLAGALRNVLDGSRRLAHDQLAALQDSLSGRYGMAALQAIDDAIDRVASAGVR